jgi:hypothetical protein
MRYEKPIVMELGSRARRADGQNPLACIAGGAAGGGSESCGAGVSAQWACETGGNPTGGVGLCVGGTTVTDGDCFGGSGVSFYCGSGGSPDFNPYGCTTGPAP